MPAKAMTPGAVIRVRLVCEGLPPGRFEGCDGRADIRVDLQTKDGFVAGISAGADALAWMTEVTVKRGTDGTPDFAGPAVHGKRGERFFYLSWSGERAGRREMFRRAKVRLDKVPPTFLEEAIGKDVVLEISLDATAKDGGPACATVVPLDHRVVRRVAPGFRDDPGMDRFVKAARGFCELCQPSDESRTLWMRRVLAQLAELYAASFALRFPEWPEDGADGAVTESHGVRDQEYRQMAEALRSRLGEDSLYWEIFDPRIDGKANPDESVAGTLWDDLADIYRDLMPGLRAWDAQEDAETRKAVASWTVPLFDMHWGVHVVSAMRALHWKVFCG